VSEAPYRIVLLESAHDRSLFHCGSESLDTYFQQRVTQDIRRRVTACFVALDGKKGIAGYYTLAAASLLLNDLPPAIGKKLPRYPSVPMIRMGRLAIAKAHQGIGLGGALLADALNRAARSEVAAYALIVDAKDELATAFYRHHGFIVLPESPRTLFLPFASLPK
jgi:ribosomal protein S18 acetylase RimI-like enzyme